MKHTTLNRIIFAVVLILCLALCGCSGSGIDNEFSDQPTVAEISE